MKMRYTIGMKRRTGNFATIDEYSGFIANVVSSVPVNSHGSRSVPAATPTASRTARRMK